MRDQGDVCAISSIENGAAASLRLSHGTKYEDFVDAQFIALALGEGLSHLRGLGWPSEFKDIDGLGEVVCAASYDYNKARCVVARLPTALGFLVTEGKRFVARLAAGSEEELDAAERLLRAAVPRTEAQPGRQEALFGFWRADSQVGAIANYAKLAVPTWAEVACNYASDTAARLERMVFGFRPGHGGKLLLWTGRPGTGKTYALRALAWEWRAWCGFHYITDPEAFLGGNPQYLMQLLTRPGPPAEWRLLLLEDSGELLSSDAKSRTGQGLSRLLNVVDGLIGHGFPTLVLVTTNEEIRSLHPAIARPGRCALHIQFESFAEVEAAAWLSARGLNGDGCRRRTLAELYAIADDFVTIDAAPRAVGFSL